MLRESIYAAVKQAMKDQDKFKLETLRYVWSEIRNLEIDVKHELNDDEVVKLLQREVKRRREAVEQFTEGGRNELADEEEAKIKVIEVYLPQMMSETEIEQVVEEVLSDGAADFGVVMGKVMGRLKGKADGKMVSEVVGKKLR